jgi:hypothetical protein
MDGVSTLGVEFAQGFWGVVWKTWESRVGWRR